MITYLNAQSTCMDYESHSSTTSSNMQMSSHRASYTHTQPMHSGITKLS